MQIMPRILLAACLLLFTTFHAAAADSEFLTDIRKVVVTGDRTAPASLVKLTGERLRRSAESTRRPVELRKVTMQVKLSRVVHGANGRNSAKVAILLSDLSGGRVSQDRFTVNSFMPGGKGRDAALAEAIVRRVALAYGLALPKAGKADAKRRPAKKRKHAGARRTVPVQPRRDTQGAERPLVIPSEAALSVRSRAAPPDTSDKAAPCVVTLAGTCD